MSQNIENLNFFIMEKFYLVGLFTFTKFQQHLSTILMNRHISLKYLYSISLKPVIEESASDSESIFDPP